MIEYYINDTTKRVAIVANGEFPSSNVVLKFLRTSNIVIACDGATSNLIKNSIHPTYVIGDHDSISIDNTEAIHVVIKNQNTNDLTKAIVFANRYFTMHQKIIFGANGIREDHFIGNFTSLFLYKIKMISDYGIFISCDQGETDIKCKTGQQISIFAEKNTVVDCNELKWPLKNFSFSNFAAGTLNESIADNLSLLSTDRIVVYIAFNTKYDNFYMIL